jgi:hypothetical protein
MLAVYFLYQSYYFALLALTLMSLMLLHLHHFLTIITLYTFALCMPVAQWQICYRIYSVFALLPPSKRNLLWVNHP